METNSSEAVLGNQGANDFAALTGGGQGAGAAASTQTAGTTPGQEQGGDTARNDGQAKVPTKPLTESPATEMQTQTGQGQQGQQGQTGTTAGTAPDDRNAVIQAAIQAAAQTVAQTRKVELEQQSQQAAATAARPKTLDQLSPDEFNQKFGVVQVTPEVITAILDQDPKKGAAAFNNIIQGAVKQAVLMTMEVANGRIDKLHQEVQPHLNSWNVYQQQVKEKAAEDRFFAAHKDLATERDLVMEIKDAMLAKVSTGQLRFNNETEAFSAVANSARQLMARYRGTTSTGTTNTTTQQAPSTGQQSGRQMSAASSAGRSGTGQAAAKSDVDAVFGEFAR